MDKEKKWQSFPLILDQLNPFQIYGIVAGIISIGLIIAITIIAFYTIPKDSTVEPHFDLQM